MGPREDPVEKKGVAFLAKRSGRRRGDSFSLIPRKEEKASTLRGKKSLKGRKNQGRINRLFGDKKENEPGR